MKDLIKYSFLYFAILLAIFFFLLLYIFAIHYLKDTRLFDFELIINSFKDPKLTNDMFLSLGVATAPYLVIGGLIFALKNKHKSLHGEASFATKLEKSQFANDGIILGKFKGKFVCVDGCTPILMYAPQGSGKSVSVAQPNLVTNNNSCIANDVKKELWQTTSGYRQKMGHKVYLFAPYGANSHRWNPFDEVKKMGSYEEKLAMIQQIATILYSAGGEAQNKSFYDSAKRLFIAISLFMLDVNFHLSFGEIRRFSTPPKGSVKKVLANVLEMHEKELHQATAGEINFFLTTKDENIATVLGFFNAPLEHYINDDLRRITDTSDFSLFDLKKTRMTIYKGTDPAFLEVSRNLFKIFTAISYSIHVKEKPNPESEPYMDIRLEDEFTSQGRIENFMQTIAYARGYNIRIIIIVQAPSQIKSIYSEQEYQTIAQSCSHTLIYTPNNINIAKELSSILGMTTMKKTRKTIGTSISKTDEEAGRALLLPQEILTLDRNKGILLSSGEKPLMIDKLLSDKLPEFNKRYKIPPPAVPKVSGYTIIENSFTKYYQNQEENFINNSMENGHEEY